MTIPAGFTVTCCAATARSSWWRARHDPVAAATRSARWDPSRRAGPRARPEGTPGKLAENRPAFDLRIHRRYNPEGPHQLQHRPGGLVGTILTMTMVIMTALAVTRERERGTMENLLAMPVHAARR